LQVRVLSPLHQPRVVVADAARARGADGGEDRVTTTTAPKPAGKPAERSGRGPLRRLNRFIREVIAELSKVIWPTRKELVTYTAVVIVFVSIMVALVAGLDILFAKGVLLVFG
jgi:preprotein translocase subunit SecE